MRNDYRNLMENQLPQTGLSASATGNTNSSRRGTREAILERGFQDRLSDTTANIQNQLVDQSLTAQQNQLSNMTAANQNLGALYNQGLANAGANQMLELVSCSVQLTKVRWMQIEQLLKATVTLLLTNTCVTTLAS